MMQCIENNKYSNNYGMKLQAANEIGKVTNGGNEHMIIQTRNGKIIQFINAFAKTIMRFKIFWLVKNLFELVQIVMNTNLFAIIVHS